MPHLHARTLALPSRIANQIKSSDLTPNNPAHAGTICLHFLSRLGMAGREGVSRGSRVQPEQCSRSARACSAASEDLARHGRRRRRCAQHMNTCESTRICIDFILRFCRCSVDMQSVCAFAAHFQQELASERPLDCTYHWFWTRNQTNSRTRHAQRKGGSSDTLHNSRVHGLQCKMAFKSTKRTLETDSGGVDGWLIIIACKCTECTCSACVRAKSHSRMDRKWGLVTNDDAFVGCGSDEKG